MYKLPYLEAVGLLPECMVLHLTKHNKQALSPYVRKGLGSCKCHADHELAWTKHVDDALACITIGEEDLREFRSTYTRTQWIKHVMAYYEVYGRYS